MKLSTRNHNGYVLNGREIKVKHKNGTVFSLFIPVSKVYRDSSKYQPHQGARECLRRRLGGFQGHSVAECLADRHHRDRIKALNTVHIR